MKKTQFSTWNSRFSTRRFSTKHFSTSTAFDIYIFRHDSIRQTFFDKHFSTRQNSTFDIDGIRQHFSPSFDNPRPFSLKFDGVFRHHFSTLFFDGNRQHFSTFFFDSIFRQRILLRFDGSRRQSTAFNIFRQKILSKFVESGLSNLVER